MTHRGPVGATVSPSSPSGPNASIFIEGDCVGVRRKGPVHTQISLASPGRHAVSSQSSTLVADLLHDDEAEQRRHFGNVQLWLQHARQHEVASHRAEKFSTPQEKWQRMSQRSRTPETAAARSPGRYQATQRQPIRHSIRRAHEILREAETKSTGHLLRAASPGIGRPIQTLRANGLPGPGSYNLPSQFQ